MLRAPGLKTSHDIESNIQATDPAVLARHEVGVDVDAGRRVDSRGHVDCRMRSKRGAAQTPLPFSSSSLIPHLHLSSTSHQLATIEQLRGKACECPRRWWYHSAAHRLVLMIRKTSGRHYASVYGYTVDWHAQIPRGCECSTLLRFLHHQVPC